MNTAVGVLLLTLVAFATASTRDVLVRSLDHHKLGLDDAGVQNGVDIYKFLFGEHPELRKHFKGRETLTPEQVQTDPWFKKQGAKLLLSLHVLASTYDNKSAFNAYIRELMERHKREGAEVPPNIWTDFWPIWNVFCSKKHDVDDAAKNAWLELGKEFAVEAKGHLARLGMPH